MNVLVEKFKEVLFAVLPVTFIVLVLNFTIAPLETHLLLRFLMGALWIILGLSIFLFGVDIGVTPIGTLMGGYLTKSNKVWFVGIAGFILGFFISVAEPDLHILAAQVASVTAGAVSKTAIVVVVSIGIAALLALGLFRIVYNKPLHILLTVIYLIIFVLALFTSPEFLAVSFDASGATTGAMTVPFILALALGVSSLKKGGKSSEEDSFGLVAIASTGAILAVIIMSIISKTDKISGSLQATVSESISLIGPFIQKLPIAAGEVFLALLPLLVIFLVFNSFSFKLTHRQFIRVMKGLIYTFIGLVLFLTGVNAGFMDVGTKVGFILASTGHPWVVILVGFILGLVVILAEPAVYVLTNQIETVTSGYVKRTAVILFLSIGVGIAVALSMLRITVSQIQLWHYLLPGYLISIIMMYYVPPPFRGNCF